MCIRRLRHGAVRWQGFLTCATLSSQQERISTATAGPWQSPTSAHRTGLSACGRWLCTQARASDRAFSDELAHMARDFAEREFLPNAARWDQDHTFSMPALRAAAEMGFAGLFVGEDVGGLGLSRTDGTAIFAALARGDVSHTAWLTIHNMVAGCIDRFGTARQREALLPDLTSLQKLGAYCLTEPGAGSDAASLTTSAKWDAATGSYTLHGAKAFISGAGVADLCIVMARTGEAGPKGISAFLVDKDAPGMSYGKPERKLGWRAQPTCAVMLDGVRVGEDARLGAEGEGFSIAMTALDGGRVNIASCSIGGAELALDTARDYVASRKQFGQPLAAFQNTAFKLADMATALQASRLMVRDAAEALDAGSPTATMKAAMAKRFATDACFDVANQALQLLGGYGYLQDYPIERILRDLRVHSILEGTNEVMRLIISRELRRQQC